MECESLVCLVMIGRLINRGWFFVFVFFQAEDGIRDLVRSRGLGDVYKRQAAGRDNRSGPLIALQSHFPLQEFSI